MADTAVAEAPPQEPAPATPAPRPTPPSRTRARTRRPRRQEGQGRRGARRLRRAEHRRAPPRRPRCLAREELGRAWRLPARRLPVAANGHHRRSGRQGTAGWDRRYVAVWAGAVFVWRRLVVLEVKAREQQLIAAAQRPRRPRPARARRGQPGNPDKGGSRTWIRCTPSPPARPPFPAQAFPWWSAWTASAASATARRGRAAPRTGAAQPPGAGRRGRAGRARAWPHRRARLNARLHPAGMPAGGANGESRRDSSQVSLSTGRYEAWVDTESVPGPQPTTSSRR